MTTKEILHKILLGMDGSESCGVPRIYWDLAKDLMVEVYGKVGVDLMEKYRRTYEPQYDCNDKTVLYTINGWSDPNTAVGPQELIEKLDPHERRDMNDIYTIDNGETFEGTLDQFRDCFFSNANEELMVSWCKEKGCKLEKRTVLTKNEE